MLEKKNKVHFWYFICIAIAAFCYYYKLGSYPLGDNNEGLYASIAQNMLLTKNFIIPRLNCMPYLEKPPLLYWLLGINFWLFGASATAARFITASSAMLTSLAILFFAHKINRPKAGILASLIFSTSIGIIIIARMVYFDMLLTFLITSSLLAFFYSYKNNTKNSLRLAYVFLALALLTKGLVAPILVFVSLLAFLLCEKNLFSGVKKLIDPFSLILFIIIALAWHILASIEHHAFFSEYIINQQFLRFFNKALPHDYYTGHIWYYLPRIVIYIFPWSLFLPLVFWRNKFNSENKQLYRFLWCTILIPLLFFSLSEAKANYYMIVSMPSLALLLGLKLNDFHQKRQNMTAYWFSFILAIFSVAFLIARHYQIQLHLFPSHENILLYISAGSSTGIITTFILRRNISWLTFTLALIMALVIWVTLLFLPKISFFHQLSSADAGIYINKNLAHKNLYMYQGFENLSALPFYAATCFKMVDSQSGDLYYAAQLPEDKNWFLTADNFFSSKEKHKYIIVPKDSASSFYSHEKSGSFHPMKIFRRVIIFHE